MNAVVGKLASESTRLSDIISVSEAIILNKGHENIFPSETGVRD